MRAHRVRVGWLLTAALLAPPLAADGPPAAGPRLVAAARAQVGVTTIYDPSYRRLAYPGGDLPRARGVCTDVVIRAYRDAFGYDLQRAVHEDMTRAWAAYPKLWRLPAPDASIDHRRVPNLVAFLRRQGAELPACDDPAGYLPGDLVTWRLPSGVPHIGFVSDRKTDGRPLVLHNIGAGAAEEDTLFAFPRTGHFRFLPAAPVPPDGDATPASPEASPERSSTRSGESLR